MAKGKPTPEKSKIARVRPLAYSRRQKGEQGDDGGDDKAEAPAADEPVKTDEAAAPEAPKAEAEAETPVDPPAIEPPPPKAEPWPEATPQPMRPVEAPVRARSQTISMPPTAAIGAPPAVPGTVEDPTQMPGPRDVPEGNVTDAALPPGRVPSGDSRSLRKDNEFALIYRVGTAVIERFGTVGQRGQWRVVEYPTPAFASSAFAKEVSRFVGEGFSDYRD
ncbi:MAG: hypothetical protein H0T46_18345 [Deltaproteobacteria bacterium]|nr:hypothetical protein [Deltaproteobacteria bacterium]